MNEYDILELIVVSDVENTKRQMKAVFHVNPFALYAGIIKYYCTYIMLFCATVKIFSFGE